jgi:hypothetical protein
MEEDSEMDEFIQTCLKGAKLNLESTGNVAGLVFFRPRNEPDLTGEKNPGDKPAMGFIPMDAAPNKGSWYQMIGETVKQIGAKFAVMVIEAWVSKNPELNEKGRPMFRPSQDPHRTEAISINGVQYDGAGFIVRSKQILVPFEKEDNKYVYLDAFTIDSNNTSEEYEMTSILADVTARDDLA